MESEYYSKIAMSYDELHGEEQIKKFRLIKGELLKHYSRDELEKKRVLDIGAGTGIASFQNSVLLDPSRELRKKAKQKEKLVGVAEDLPFEDNSFDLIISLSALHHVDIKRAIREIKRVIQHTNSTNQTIKNKSMNDKKEYIDVGLIDNKLVDVSKEEFKEKPKIILSIFKRSNNFKEINEEIRSKFKVLKEIDEGIDWIYFCES